MQLKVRQASQVVGPTSMRSDRPSRVASGFYWFQRKTSAVLVFMIFKDSTAIEVKNKLNTVGVQKKSRCSYSPRSSHRFGLTTWRKEKRGGGGEKG